MFTELSIAVTDPSQRIIYSKTTMLQSLGWVLTRNLRFCFQQDPWALVCRCASVTILMSSHSALSGSGLICSVRTISSLFLRSRFSSIRRRLATRLLSSNTTDRQGEGECCMRSRRSQKGGGVLKHYGSSSTLQRWAKKYDSSASDSFSNLGSQQG